MVFCSCLRVLSAANWVLASDIVDIETLLSPSYYAGVGLAKLCHLVLGVPLPKVRRVVMGNWEARLLSRSQLKYAALDVLVAAQVGVWDCLIVLYGRALLLHTAAVFFLLD